jgi:hypothetical protein
VKHCYICFFLVIVWPCQWFVRLWYRVSDVLDLSLVSKRFGFWPHIAHVIVLTQYSCPLVFVLDQSFYFKCYACHCRGPTYNPTVR